MMRNLVFIVFFMIIAMSITSIACQKEEKGDVEKKNSFSYDGKSYDTPKGNLILYGENEDKQSADFDVLLCSTTVNYNASEFVFTGKGDAIYIDFNSPSLTELVSGTYTYDATYFTDATLSRKPNTFIYAKIYVDADFDNNTDAYYKVDKNTTGTITINKSENTYEISYNFVLETGKKVEGYYRGSLESIDVTEKKSVAIEQSN